MKVNGMEKEIGEGLTVEQYLQNEGFVKTRVAVELNGAIISKADYSQVILSPEDRIEIVNFVGGG